METWQKTHITNNLVSLINMTVCTVELLAHLEANGVLASEDVAKMKRPTLTEREQASLLYDTIITRKDSYMLMTQALKHTKQSGALAVLENHIFKPHHSTDIKYDKKKLLGRGNMGTKVYEGVFAGREVAVKVMSTELVDVDIAHNEINSLLKLDFHPNIVQYFTANFDDDFVLIVLEKCAISLQEEVKANLVQMEAVEILRKCTQGLDHLHNHKLIHSDLKPSNILLTLQKEVKISDFGLSKQIPVGHSSVTASGVRGTMDWMAPEILNYFVTSSNESKPLKMTVRTDIFALGCIFHFVLTKGVHPFGANFEIPVNIRDNIQHIQASQFSEEWLRLINNMISPNALERPTTSDILNKNVFCSYDSGKLQSSANEIGKSAAKIVVRDPHKPIDVTIKKSSSIVPPLCEKGPNANQPILRETETRDPAVASRPWKSFALRWNSVELARVTTFSDTFLKCLRRQQILSEFTFNKARKWIKKHKEENIYETAFTKEDYYDGIMRALMETNQPDVLAIMVGYEESGKWQNPQVPLTTSDFNSLAEAIGYGCDVSVLKTFYERHEDKSLLLQTDDDGRNLLHIAVGCGRIDVIKYLISVNLSVNLKDNKNNAALHYLGRYSDNIVAVTNILLDNGAELLAKNSDSDTVAHLLCYYVTPELYWEWMKYTIENGHKSLWMEKGQGGHTPLNFAVNNTEISEKTLRLLASELKYDFNVRSAKGDTAIMLAADGGQPKSILECIVKLGGDWKLKGYVGKAILHFAVQGGNLEAVQYFLALGADPNGGDENKSTPLHYLFAASFNHIEMTKTFIAHKANLLAYNSYGFHITHTFDRQTELQEEFLEWKNYLCDNGHGELFQQNHTVMDRLFRVTFGR